MSESRVTWATSAPILVFLGLSVLELDPMYATDRQTDRQTSDVRQKHRLMPPPYGGGGIITNSYRKLFNPENPGITRIQSRDFGIGKIGRDLERLQSLHWNSTKWKNRRSWKGSHMSGLASLYWPCVTNTMFIHLGAQRPESGRWAAHQPRCLCGILYLPVQCTQHKHACSTVLRNGSRLGPPPSFLPAPSFATDTGNHVVEF